VCCQERGAKVQLQLSKGAPNMHGHESCLIMSNDICVDYECVYWTGVICSSDDLWQGGHVWIIGLTQHVDPMIATSYYALNRGVCN
jgi:hypothetical protein